MQLIVMGNDPATKNYGYAIAKFYLKKSKIKYKILSCGMVDDTLQDLKEETKEQLLMFLNAISKIEHLKNIDHLVIERYINRGRFSGNSNETVNQMIGALTVYAKCDVTQIMSSTWKNAVMKHCVLDKATKTSAKIKAGDLSLYKLATKNKLPVHIVDAFLQAAYYAQKELGVNFYETLTSMRSREKLIKRLLDGVSFNQNKN